MSNAKGKAEFLAMPIEERRRKMAECYDQYEVVQEIVLDCELKGALAKGKEWMENFRPELVWRLMGDVEGKKVLDVGCQYGVFSFYLGEKGASVTGMDISKRWIERCQREAAEKYPDKEFHFLAGDAQELPFDDESFDAVLCSEVIEHVEHPGNVLSEINRVLKPEGVFVLSTPNTDSYYVKTWQVLKAVLPMTQVRKLAMKVLNMSLEDAYIKVRMQLPEGRREEFDREVEKLKAMAKELQLENEDEEISEHIREFSTGELELLLDLMGFEVEKKSGFPVFPTYYFLTLRMLIREKFVKVKDDSWWRYHSSPFAYFRAVKKSPALFHL
jgi:ubiquinone biosynthesis O-methyltransferase